MRPSTRSASLRFTAAALMFGLIGAVHAADAQQLPVASAAAQNNQQSSASDAFETRVDWNIDYPSQLGPEGPRVATMTASHNGAALAQQPAHR